MRARQPGADNPRCRSTAPERAEEDAVSAGAGTTKCPARKSRALRVSSSRGEDTMPDPNHHLWRNGRLYWVAFTVHLPGWQKERVRLSLGTADLEEARRRRDELLLEYPRARTCELSLRLEARPRRGGRASPGLAA